MPNVIETTDAAAGSGTTYTLKVGQTGQGAISSTSDQDWFRVDLVAGQTYTFAATGSGNGAVGLGDPVLTLRNSAGASLRTDDDSGPDYWSSMTFTATSTGTFYLGVAGSGGTGRYGVSATTGTKALYDEQMGAATLQRNAYPHDGHLGFNWGAAGQGVNLTWAARATNPGQTDAQGGARAFIPLSAQQVAASAMALGDFADVSGVTFTQVNPGGRSDNATMLFSAYKTNADGAGAYASYPYSTATGSQFSHGDVNLNNEYVSTTSLGRGSWEYSTLLHEIGHALGLAHPGEYAAAPGLAISYANNAQFIQDSEQYTVMSYFGSHETNGSNVRNYPDTLMLYDILAVQQLYGVNTATRTGNSIYGFGANTGDVFDFTKNTDPAVCIWDAGGTDTLNASGFSMAQKIDLNAGKFSNIGGFLNNVSIAFGAVIENAIGGSGNDTIYGNSANNVLDGRGGVDTLIGGAGNDTYVLGAENDSVNDSSGVDTITSTITRSLAAYTTIENLTLLGTGNINGTGNDLNNVIIGTSGKNTLVGGNGNDTLDGLTGIDILNGGGGSDIYVLGAESDSITDSSGVDTITSTITRSLAGYAMIENLTLLGTGNINGTGNDLSNVIIGTSGKNTLVGGNGNDTLDGLTGIDILNGGGGSDIYVLGAESDSITDSSGVDTITSTITRSLAGYAMIENLTLLGTGNINGTGNDLNNVIIGTSGKNTLVGGNGNDTLDGLTGVDTLNGGAGNDIYVLGSESDSIVDSAGSDTITSTITRSLTGYTAIENLTLLGTGDINGTGNDLNNVIRGTSGKNTLVGGNGNDTLDGLTGIDILNGGAGNDTYVLGAESDSVTDSSGVDTITSAISRSLAGYATIENLTLLGTAKINGTGNGLSNTITGNEADNVLNGGAGNDKLIGGAGKDTLTGGAGVDSFLFNAALSASTNVDNITDFVVADDTILLENAIFTVFTTVGAILTGNFVKGTDGLAKDNDDYLIYETDTGNLFYDNNGKATGGSTLIAHLTVNLGLTYNDFLIV
ncbi:M10 family metallopeptidase C-terminal domain-containing protein [Rhizobium sp. XQZ8]|uniref:M10 family metallopeptidase C-terminal domain-containing protein n=1 Tax=Rhizobium populisoli TaxID=2859785 RepID=UPI001CA5735D|nr:M10 family metallopeptidase C-terminal domain-containing protein [Rhizobium populisoli]MBW6420234.1 M10 family metallopeptidase C-terminal domain-containing protein [Rhizobium populisoli]